jgi:hypothetical protein
MMDWRRVLLTLIVLSFGAAYAHGEIVYRTPIRPGTYDPIDLDNNGRPDFSFGIRTISVGQDTLSFFFAIDQPQDLQPKNGVLTLGDDVPEVQPGTGVGPSTQNLTWDDDFDDAQIPGVSPVGSLHFLSPSPVTQLIGVRFHAEDGLHYGWMRLARSYWAPYDFAHPNWPEDPGSVFNWELPRIDQYNPGVLDWAYESTPNTPIVAGAVPEPAGMVLAAVGALMLVALRWRRRCAS